MNPGAVLVHAEHESLLSRKIRELSLKIEATHLGELVAQLYGELETAGIRFKPKTYLTDVWGCPNEVPVIGIPFFLSDPIQRCLKTDLNETVDDDTYIAMVLRHEAGHAFNYAYRIYDQPEWQNLFGWFSLPYENEYEVDPSSTRFVQHLPGCYAQRHPDDDFAETFAVWLTPRSNWQDVYAGSPALAKLSYVNEVVAGYGEKPPMVTDGRLDMPVEEMAMTLGEWYEIVYRHRDESASHPRPRAVL